MLSCALPAISTDHLWTFNDKYFPKISGTFDDQVTTCPRRLRKASLLPEGPHVRVKGVDICLLISWQGDVDILAMGKTVYRQRAKLVFAARDLLRKSAEQLVSKLGWRHMDVHAAYNRVECWLGPVEELCLQAGNRELELLLQLRGIQQVISQTTHMYSPWYPCCWECCHGLPLAHKAFWCFCQHFWCFVSTACEHINPKKSMQH